MNTTSNGRFEPVDGRSGDRGDGGAGANGAGSAGSSDAELRAFLEERGTAITVVGCGGGGCNTVTRLARNGVSDADLVAANTDAQSLLDARADRTLLIGRGQTGGRGAGAMPQVGERAALENRHAIADEVEGSDLVFVTAGLGGGTGTGAAPVVARAAQEAGALTVAVVTMPFASEGEQRRLNAEAGLERLREVADTVVVISNDRLLDVVGDLPVRRAFEVADEVLMRAVTGISELVTTPGMVNLDFSDVRTVMGSGGLATIGFGESDSATKAEDAVAEAVGSPLLDVDVAGASAALVNVTGGPGMTIDEAERAVEEIHERTDPGARIIWGTAVDEGLDGLLRTMIVVTGIPASRV